VALEANRGATARNIGVRLARTRYVAFSDDDSWWAPGALATAVAVMDAHPRQALLVARIRLGANGDVDHVSQKMAAAPLGQEPDLPGPSVLGFPACAAVLRRTAFLEVGGFDDLLFFGGEESLLALGLAQAGWGLAYVEQVTACHAPSKRRRPPVDRWSLQRRNDLLVSWMRLSYPAALRRSALLAREAVHDPPARRAFGQLLVRLPTALVRRRRVAPRWEDRLRILHELEQPAVSGRRRRRRTRSTPCVSAAMIEWLRSYTVT
jgi:GT2 family glycosyltransferase